VGEVSPAVVTDAGTHFIRLEERIAAESIDTDAVLAELEASMAAAESERMLLLAVEELRDLVFNAADLDGPASQIKSKVKRSTPFSAESGEGLFSDQRLRDTAFSEEVLERGNNSEVLELSGKRFVVVRLNERRPPQVAPFADVETDIRRRVRAEIEAAALITMQTQVEQSLRDGGTLESVANELNLEWRVELASTRLSSQLPRSVLDAAFSMSAGRPNVLEIVAVPEQGYALVQLARVSAGDISTLSTREASAIRGRRYSEQRELSFGEYLIRQRNTADIIIR